MPVTTQEPPQPNAVDFQQEPFKFGDTALSPDWAITLVVETFLRFERARNNNFEGRWLDIDALYEGNVPLRYWEGSNVPRSCIPDNIAFDHVEGAVPRIESELFSNPEWFAIEAMNDTSPQDARDQQAVLEHYLTLPDDRTCTTGKTEIRLGIKNDVKYGTMIGLLEWKNDGPRVINLDIRDVYFDEANKTPFADNCNAIIVRSAVTIAELNELRENPRLNIPSDPVLRWLLTNIPPAMADNTKSQGALVEGIQTFPFTTDQLPLPQLQQIELLRYFDRTRVIYLLNRSWVMFSGANPITPYLPIVAAPCRLQSNTIYGKGYPDAIRWQQRTAEALMNGHIDELALALNPPVTGPRDANPNEMLIRPGRYMRTDNPKDLQIFQAQNATTNVFGEIQQLHQDADRRNGLSSMAQGQAPRGNSLRTKAGVDTQAEGTDLRTYHVVKNIEEFFIIPMLKKMVRMIQVHTTPDQVLLPAYPAPENHPPYRTIRADIFHKPARFKMEAASQMLTRDRVGALIQPVMQALIQGPIVAGLAEQGMSINFKEFAQMVQDAGGLTKRYELVIPMSEEQKKAKNAPPPQAVAEMQQKQTDQQLRFQLGKMKQESEMAGHQVELEKTRIMKAPDPSEAQLRMQESQMRERETQQKMEMERQKMGMKAQSDQQKMMNDRIAAGEKLKALQMKNQIDMQKAQADLEAKAAGHMLDRQIAEHQAAMTARTAEADTQATIASHRIGLRQQQEMGDVKREQVKMNAAAKPPAKPKS